MTVTPEYVGEIWAKTTNPTTTKVADIIRRSGQAISPKTVWNMKNSGWVSPPRTGKRGRPRMSEALKTAANKIITFTPTFTGDKNGEDLPTTMGFSDELRDYLAGKDVSFDAICDEMNRVFGRTITVMLKRLFESDMMIEHPQNFVKVFGVLTAGVLAINNPMVKAAVEANMKLINGGGDPEMARCVSPLESFLTAHGG